MLAGGPRGEGPVEPGCDLHPFDFLSELILPGKTACHCLDMCIAVNKLGAVACGTMKKQVRTALQSVVTAALPADRQQLR